MRIEFSKMHSIGNDFIVVNNLKQQIKLSNEQIQMLARRRFGIGFDQLLVLEPAKQPQADFCMRVFNADGNEVGQCGNGVRCLASFIHRQNLTTKPMLQIESTTTMMSVEVQSQDYVRASLGIPQFEPENIPFLAEKPASTYSLFINGSTIEVSVLSVGNPHAVAVVADIIQVPVDQLGQLINANERFPEGVNVEFMQVINPQLIKLRVYERGVGETLACGSGACAAVIAGKKNNLLSDSVQVELPGGSVQVNWATGQQPVWFEGPVTHVYEGWAEI